MSKIGSSVKPRVIMLDILILMLGIAGYYMFYNYTYSTLDIKTKSELVLEYGTEKYNLKKFIKSSSGKIENIDNSIDTSKVGKQKVDVTLSKYNVSKTVSFYVDVVDNVSPVISIKEENITITEGDSLDLFENITSVVDDVDGDIGYVDNVESSDKDSYYTVNTDFDNNNSGTYQVDVRAVDSSNNEATASFTVTVEEKPVVVYRQASVVANPGVNTYGLGIVNTAYALLGSPYVGGGNSPSGFDCSGFVQYVYSQNGIYISRSSSTQIYDGVGVSLENAQPGDILIWGYSNGVVTHSALYVGNDLMIHAANPSTGVILSSVSGWTRGSNVQVLYVRRVVA